MSNFSLTVLIEINGLMTKAGSITGTDYKDAVWLVDYWCGSCRTECNTCSFAICSPDGICPNTKCDKKKGFDGRRECLDF